MTETMAKWGPLYMKEQSEMCEGQQEGRVGIGSAGAGCSLGSGGSVVSLSR